ARRLARHANHRESKVGQALRGHVTFWGFLLGVGLAYDTVVGIYTQALAQGKPNPTGLPPLLFSVATQTDAHKGLLALFVISLTLMLARVVTVLIVASSATTARPVVSLVTNVTRFIVLIIGFMLVLAVFEVNIAPWLATLGIVGLAVSLALQATLTDLVSGMLLLASRQLIVGEYVKLSTGEEGYISDITWRTTTIRQVSNDVVIVPNSKMTSLPVTNYHSNAQNSGVSVDLGVSYTSDLDLVERATVEVAQDVMRTTPGGVPNFTPTVRFNTLGDYSIRLTVTMQAQEIGDQNLIKHEFIKRLRRRYHDEGISIPYPIQSVQLREPHDSGAVAPGRDGAGDDPSGAASSGGPQASVNSSEASSR
ncbi:MAG TPA: mechanosensitive ion channel family protein, partial [Ktedonobacterales bacterium]